MSRSALRRHHRHRWSVLLVALVTFALMPTAAQAWFGGAAEGKLAFASAEGGQMHIWTVKPDGSGKRQITFGPLADTDPAWSPNGELIAFTQSPPESVSGAGAGTGGQIWTVSGSGGAPQELTSGPSDFAPVWAPDGNALAFVRSVDGTENVWTMAADGSDQNQLTDLSTGTTVSGPTYTPDGSKIVFSALLGGTETNGSEEARLYEISLSGGGMHEITPYGFASFDNSPDVRAGGTAAAPAPELLFAHNAKPQLKLGGAGDVFGDDAGTAIDTTDLDPFGVHTGTLRWSPVEDPTPPDRFAYLIQSAVSVYDVGIYPTGRLTWDGSPKEGLSWAPAPAPQHFTIGGAAGVVHVPTPHVSIVAVFIICSTTAGRHGCADVLELSRSHGRPAAELTIHLKSGVSRKVKLRIPRRVRPLLGPGTSLHLVLIQHVRGRRTRAVFSAGRVDLPASVSQTCPATGRVGSPLDVSAVLTAAARAGSARAASVNSGKRLTLVAIGPAGQVETLIGKTGSNGRLSAAMVLDEPGRWTIQAIWTGDSLHAPTTSPGCGVTVAPRLIPPRAPTKLSISCPGTGTVKGQLPTAGVLSSGLAGATIAVTYSDPGASGGPQTITHEVTTVAGGNWSDSATTNYAGTWTSQASFAGDASRLPTQSPTCTTTVS